MNFHNHHLTIVGYCDLKDTIIEPVKPVGPQKKDTDWFPCTQVTLETIVKQKYSLAVYMTKNLLNMFLNEKVLYE